MKIGIHTYAWGSHFGNDTLYIIDCCRELGMDYVEFPLMEIDAFDPVAVKARLGDLEPTTSARIPRREWDVASDDPQEREWGRTFLRRCVEKTAAVGAQVFSGNFYVGAEKENKPTQAEWERSVEAVRMTARLAADLGVRIGIEAVSRFANNLVNTARQAVRFVEDVGESNVFVHLDSFHMAYEERDLPAAIRFVGGRLGYFHMAGNDRGRPGDDDLFDWDAIFSAFKEIGFDDYLGFEGFDMTCGHIYRDIIGDPMDFARESRAYALKMLEKHGF